MTQGPLEFETHMEIAFVNPPPPDKADWSGGSIKGVDGLKVFLPHEHPHTNFTKGQQLRVGGVSKPGGPYGATHTLTRVDGVSVVSDRRNGAAPAPQMVPPVAPPIRPVQPVSEPSVNGKERVMFITGGVGRSMGSGKFNVGDIESLTKAFVLAWRFVANPNLITAEARNDERPAQPHHDYDPVRDF
jgi:hypothetical protein